MSVKIAVIIELYIVAVARGIAVVAPVTNIFVITFLIKIIITLLIAAIKETNIILNNVSLFCNALYTKWQIKITSTDSKIVNGSDEI